MIQYLFFMCFISMTGQGYDCDTVVNYIQNGSGTSYYDHEKKHIFLYDLKDFTELWKEALKERAIPPRYGH